MNPSATQGDAAGTGKLFQAIIDINQFADLRHSTATKPCVFLFRDATTEAGVRDGTAFTEDFGCHSTYLVP